jgi:hypothetical protein
MPPEEPDLLRLGAPWRFASAAGDGEHVRAHSRDVLGETCRLEDEFSLFRPAAEPTARPFDANQAVELEFGRLHLLADVLGAMEERGRS